MNLKCNSSFFFLERNFVYTRRDDFNDDENETFPWGEIARIIFLSLKKNQNAMVMTRISFKKSAYLKRGEIRIPNNFISLEIFLRENMFLENHRIATKSRCVKITEKVSFNIASKASYVYILSGQELTKNAKNGLFWQSF